MESKNISIGLFYSLSSTREALLLYINHKIMFANHIPFYTSDQRDETERKQLLPYCLSIVVAN